MNNEYLYYKGQQTCPYSPASDEAYFFSQEERHELVSEFRKNHLDNLKRCFEKDYEELHKKGMNETTWEVICLCLEDMYETGYHDFDKCIERIKRYGSN